MSFVLFFLATLFFNESAGLVPRQTTCSFSMSAFGTPNGTIVESATGEIQIGGTYPQGYYYITNNILYDTSRNNCNILPGSSQLQCTTGALGAPISFSFADNGNLLHNGSANWLACAASSPGYEGSYNIFSDAKADPSGCEAITLRTGSFNCTALGRPSSSASASTLLPTIVTTSTSFAIASTSATPIISCPTDISSGVYQLPHLIVPTSPEAPDYAFGNTLSATISPINSTLFNFEFPSVAPYNNTCALLFLFPFGAATYFSGIEEEEGEHGGLDFALLAEVANANTTYDTTGDVATDYGKFEVLPGNNYTVATFDCKAGTTVTYSVSSKGNVEVDYIEATQPSPIGLYIVPCEST